MDVTLASIIKTAMIITFVLPFFSMLLLSLPTTPPSPLAQGTNESLLKNYSLKMNKTSMEMYTMLNNFSNKIYIITNSSFSQNPTIFTAFAFIISGLGVFMQSLLQLPQLDLAAINLITSGLSVFFPPYIVGAIRIGLGLLYTYLVLSLIFLGVSMIQKYNIKT
ncbi:MAG: hypothetical protein ACP5HJ_01770 [Candidatus Micrarchaeia archaeon]